MTDIGHLADVLPHVEGRPDFVVKRADGYVAVDYVYAGADTFDHPVRVECRGLKFRPDGAVLARPLHKFFNAGERPETQVATLDLSRPHVVTEKLDGSMVHSVVLGGEPRLMTRMGLTDTARACEERWLKLVQVRDLAQRCAVNGVTATFEWTAPTNRVVLWYPEDRLTLLAVRGNVSGRYLNDEFVRHLAPGFPRPAVLGTDAYGDWAGLAHHCEGLEAAEGFVVWFTDGHEPRAVKVKAPWYVTRHRALDGLRTEAHVVRLVLDGGVDDVLPLVDEATRSRLARFNSDLLTTLTGLALEASDVARNARRAGYGRKAFATTIVPRLTRTLSSVAFAAWDGRSAVDSLWDLTRKQANSGPRLAEFLDKLGAPRWK